jgi:L-fuconolactonase
MSPFKNILNLSGYKNVYIKIPGLGELTSRPNLLNNHYPFIKDRFDIIRTTMDFFTSKRMMWGSDFPPVSNREGYRNSLKGILKLENISEDEKNDVFSVVPKKLFFS